MDHSNEAGDAGDGASEEEIWRKFREMTEHLIAPLRNECLVCFLMRMMPLMQVSGFSLTATYRDSNAPRATNLFERLGRLGICGDASLVEAGVVVNDAVWEADCCPDCGIPCDVPDCLEVRLGSTQPCKLWRWRQDAEREQFGDWLNGLGLRPNF